MSYEVTFEQCPDYIHARVTGINGRETVTAYLDDVLRECHARDCFRVLIEERLEGPRLPVMDIFAISSEGSMKALGVFDAIAYVDEEMGDMRNFVETVAVNRGMPIATFARVAEAEAWLCEHSPGVDDKKIFFDPAAKAED